MSMNDGPQWEPVQTPEPQPTAPAPMRLGQVFEVGRRILVRHWSVLLLIALLFTGPGALLSSATALRFTEVAIDLFPDLESGTIDTELRLSAAELDRLLGSLWPFLGASLLAGVLGSIGALAFSATVADDYHARPAAIGSVLRASLRRTPSALMFMLVTGLLIARPHGGGPAGHVRWPRWSCRSRAEEPEAWACSWRLIIAVALAVALVYVTMRWAPAYTAMVEEDAGWRQALRRSWHLSGDNVLRIFALSAVVAIITGLLSSLLGAVFDTLITAVVGPPLGLDPLVGSTIALAMAAVIVAPAMPVFTAVLFFDLRTRRDPPPAAVDTAPPSPYA